MKTLILGSTGGTGQQLIKQALEQHHEVTALVRDTSKLTISQENLTVVKGDALDRNVLLKAVEGKDAVLSALGVGKSLNPKGLIANAAGLLIAAMNATGVKRLIFLSAFGVGETYRQASFIQRIIFSTFLRKMYADKVKGDDQIRNSNLGWTLIYPVLLTDKPGTGNYKAEEALPMKGMPKISRADVADFMLKQLKDNTFLRKPVVVMN